MSKISSGTAISRTDISEPLARVLNKGLGAANVERKAFGAGRGEAGDDVGVFRAVWATVKLSGGSGATFDVAHSLGRVPVACMLVDWENPTLEATWIIARPVERSKWSESSCRVSVHLAAGSLDGCLARFWVWGE